MQEPHVNCQVSSTTFSSKNLYNNLVNIFDNKNQNINQINNFNNNLTNYNNLVIANTNLLYQIPEIPSGKEGSNSIAKCDCVFCNPSKLIKESVVNFEILSSYKNINIITKGNYINNEKFQKATYKFFNYYISTSSSKNIENLSNTDEEYFSYDLSSFNPYSQEESMIVKKNSKNTLNSNFFKNFQINSDNKKKNSPNNKKEKYFSKNEKDIKNISKSIKNDEKEFENKRESIKNMNIEKINKKKLNLCLDIDGKNKIISDSKNSCFLKTQNHSKVSEASKTNKKITENNYIKILEDEFNDNNNNNNVFDIDFEEHNKKYNSDIIIENAKYMPFGEDFISKKIKKILSRKENKEGNIRRSFLQSKKGIKTNKNFAETNDNNNKFCVIY